MRFRTRVFLLSFLPFALLLAFSFWAIQDLVQVAVRNGLRATLRENQLSISDLRSRHRLESGRFLRVAGENTSLKAGMQLLRSYPGNPVARATVEDQLGEWCERAGFDLLLVSDPSGTPLAGVLRSTSSVSPPLSQALGEWPRTTKDVLQLVQGKLYQIATVPLDQGEENLGFLSVGEVFDLAQFSTPTILLQHGSVVQSSIPGLAAGQALGLCGGQEGREKEECAIHLGGAEYLSVSMHAKLGNGYELRSMSNVDAARAPVQKMLNEVFLVAGLACIAAALVCSVVASRAIVRPIMAIVSHLRGSETTGLLPEFQQDLSPIREMRELTASFNRAGNAIREAKESLQRAYLEFVGSLANALDARDPYTAGHSRRVSELSCAIAASLDMQADRIGQIRIGALLHDIGKIGVSDTVLCKPGRLTDDEFARIKEHPSMGRRILEGVHGFSPYLSAVELHHENWDGSGYPRGEKAEETPIAARIIHVADAYDAMTTDRPYRRGMTHAAAMGILTEFAGRQFDPNVVAALRRVTDAQDDVKETGLPRQHQLQETT